MLVMHQTLRRAVGQAVVQQLVCHRLSQEWKVPEQQDIDLENLQQYNTCLYVGVILSALTMLHEPTFLHNVAVCGIRSSPEVSSGSGLEYLCLSVPSNQVQLLSKQQLLALPQAQEQ